VVCQLAAKHECSPHTGGFVSASGIQGSYVADTSVALTIVSIQYLLLPVTQVSYVLDTEDVMCRKLSLRRSERDAPKQLRSDRFTRWLEERSAAAARAEDAAEADAQVMRGAGGLVCGGRAGWLVAFLCFLCFFAFFAFASREQGATQSCSGSAGQPVAPPCEFCCQLVVFQSSVPDTRDVPVSLGAQALMDLQAAGAALAMGVMPAM
jgi:hypothetical protein